MIFLLPAAALQDHLLVLYLLLTTLPPGQDCVHAELQVRLVGGSGRGGEIPEKFTK